MSDTSKNPVPDDSTAEAQSRGQREDQAAASQRPCAGNPFPSKGRLLGLDYGTKRVGIAISTYEQTIASPLSVYQVQSPSQDARFLQKVARENDCVGLIVGLPVHMSGAEGGKAREARVFGAWAAEVTGLPVAFYDERYTSSMAEDHLLAAELSKKKRKERLDKLAAQIMLQSYLDAPDRGRAPDDIRRDA